MDDADGVAEAFSRTSLAGSPGAMLVRRFVLAVALTAIATAGACATTPSAAPAPAAVCPTEAVPTRVPNTVTTGQEERIHTEMDDNLAPLDLNAVTSQGHRLEAAGSEYPDTFGGVILDQVVGELTVRYVNTSEGPALLKAVAGLAPRRGDVPVRFAEVNRPLLAMKALAAELTTTRDWAGTAAPCLHEVSFNELDYQLSMDASGAADQLVEAVRARTGLTPQISISLYGVVPQ